MELTGNSLLTSMMGLHFFKEKENTQTQNYTLALSDAAGHEVGLLI